MIGPHDVTSIFGIRGSGKSTLSRNLSSIYPRLIIFDRLGEWGDIDGFNCSDAESFSKIWKQTFRSPSFKIVVSFEPGTDGDDLQREVSSILKTIYNTGRSGLSEYSTCLVIEEAQFYSSPQSINPWLFEVCLTGRHAKIAIILNSQRPASIHKSLISQSHNIFVGQLFEMRDIKYLTDTIGDAAFRARSLPQGAFLWHRLGCPVRVVNSKPEKFV